MRKELKYFLTLVWFCYLIITSILLFKKGFLLTRQVQPHNASCTTLELPQCSLDDTCAAVLHKHYDNANKICLESNKKVILLIVDALRYDFTLFNEQITNPLPYENKLPVISEILKKSPQNARLYKFIADPPTTTMQRLKGLTTGSLPTFIDAGSNFATSEINEDNIIDQINKIGKKIVFMGDDTWNALYPNRFARNYPYPSFDVWDLDTVDSGVKSKLFLELNNTDWDLLIGHFLGVDHCGHRYGPNHPEMSRKLGEINEVINDVIGNMDEDSMLFVIGDHGMTATGDHGGESLDEIQAAMFVYSKQPLWSFDIKSSVKQVDLVPTLSIILQTPVPYQNLGIIISSSLPMQKSWQVPLFWSWGNVQQVVRYIKTYSESSKVFDEESLYFYLREYEELGNELLTVDSHTKFLALSGKLEEFMIKIRLLCEEVWVQFDSLAMSNGMTFLFLAIFFLFILGDGIPLKDLPWAIEGSFVVVCTIVLLFSAIFLILLDFLGLVTNSNYGVPFITNVLSIFMFILPLIQNWGVISENWFEKHKAYGVLDLICRFVLIFNVATVFSNSFINEESSVLLFLLVTVLMACLYSLGALLQRNDTNSKKKLDNAVSLSLFLKIALGTFAILVILRCTMYFWRCRTEQEWCFKTIQSAKESTKLHLTLSAIFMAAYLALIKIWLKKCGNLNGYSLNEVLVRLIPTVIVVCTAGSWVLHKLSGKNASITRTSTFLALSVYVLSVFSIIMLMLKPICVSILFRNEDGSVGDSDIITSIFKKIKGEISGNGSGNRTPIVCGLATAYSSVYIILSIYVVMTYALVLGDLFATSSIIFMAVSLSYVLLTSILRIKQAQTIDDLFKVPTITVLGWILISQYFFFATGHQPAFSNIAWESAFVGTKGLFTSNFILGGVILMNTFGSHFITGLILPLLVIGPFTVLIMMPGVYSKQKGLFKDCQKGEMILFEKERMSLAALFSVSCKYIAGHAIKVFASMLAATIHCRHLMVWNVFAPKFIFESVSLFVSLFSVLVGFLIYLRIHSQVESFVVKVNKMN